MNSIGKTSRISRQPYTAAYRVNGSNEGFRVGGTLTKKVKFSQLPKSFMLFDSALITSNLGQRDVDQAVIALLKTETYDLIERAVEALYNLGGENLIGRICRPEKDIVLELSAKPIQHDVQVSITLIKMPEQQSLDL